MTTYSIAIGKMETTDGLINVEREMLRFENLQWTTEPPEREGFYFALSRQYTDSVELVEVYNSVDGKFAVSTFNDADALFPLNNLSDYVSWLGPIPAPEPPSEGE